MGEGAGMVVRVQLRARRMPAASPSRTMQALNAHRRSCGAATWHPHATSARRAATSQLSSASRWCRDRKVAARRGRACRSLGGRRVPCAYAPSLGGKIVGVRPARASSGYRSGGHSSGASNTRCPARPAWAATAAAGWRAALRGLTSRAPASYREVLVVALAPPRPSALRSEAARQEPGR